MLWLFWVHAEVKFYLILVEKRNHFWNQLKIQEQNLTDPNLSNNLTNSRAGSTLKGFFQNIKRRRNNLAFSNYASALKFWAVPWRQRAPFRRRQSGAATLHLHQKRKNAARRARRGSIRKPKVRFIQKRIKARISKPKTCPFRNPDRFFENARKDWKAWKARFEDLITFSCLFIAKKRIFIWILTKTAHLRVQKLGLINIGRYWLMVIITNL